MTASSGVPELAELILTAAGYEMNGMSALGQTRPFGDVGSMSGLLESGRGWAIL